MNANLTLVRLRHILALARTGSFSLAAEEEGISQPAFSRSIQAFEAHYGVRLFDRGSGRARLTPAGALALAEARNTLTAAQALDKAMSDHARGAAGRLSIGFGPLMASLLLPRIGRELLHHAPALQIATRIAPVDQLVEDLVEGRIEAAIGNRWSLGQIPGVTRRVLGSVDLAMIVRRGHPALTLSGKGPLAMADLAAYPVAGAVERAPLPGGAATGAFVCDNFHVLRDIVLETDCLWLTAPAFVMAELERGDLSVLGVADLAPAHAEIWLAVLNARTVSPALAEVARLVGLMLSPDR